MKSIIYINLARALTLTLGSGAAHAQKFQGRMVVAPIASSAECQQFTDFATQRQVDPNYISASNSKLDPFETDGLLVLKDGQPVYEWYDGLINEETPHILWSASKDVTATLMARTIQDGYTYNGKKVTLDSHVNEFFPNPGLLKAGPEMKSNYDKMTIRHLIEMSANFKWKEYYDEDLQNSNFLPMLYLNGKTDMAAFALNTPLSPEGPGGRWNFSGGNANILMAILRKIHGANYETMPQNLLFNRLGMRNVRIERDDTGLFVGSSYIYMRLRDMANFGQLYLQKGRWNGQQLLPPTWTDDAQVVGDAVSKESVDVIKKLGTEGKRVMWLNKNVYRADGSLLYPQEMPQAPGDMIFAAGHYGQLVIVIPSHHLVIARTGYNLKYWDHIQPLVVKALACVEPGYKPNLVSDLTPPSADAKQSVFEGLWSTASSAPTYLNMLSYLSDSGLGSAIAAKEMCSFLFTMDTAGRIPGGEAQMSSVYMDRSGLPAIVKQILLFERDVAVDAKNKKVTVSRYYTPNGRKALLDRYEAKVGAKPEAGCNLQRMDVAPLNLEMLRANPAEELRGNG